MIELIKKITATGKRENYGTFGTLFFDEFFRGELGFDWEIVGSSATYDVSNGIVVDRSGSGLDDYIKNISNVSTLEKYILTCRYKVNTIDNSSHGVAIGQQGDLIAKSHIAGIRTDSANLGKIFIYQDNDFLNPIYESASAIVINTGDVLEIEINYSISDFTVVAKNITLGTQISHTINNVLIYPTTDLPRSGKTGVYSLYVTGGESFISYVRCVSSETKRSNYCIVGDSITERYASTTLENSVQGRLKASLGGEWVTFGGGGNYTTQILKSIGQLIRLKPQNIILFISTNDFANGGRSLIDVQNDYTSIVDQLEAVGINVILAENIPRTGEDFSVWNNWLDVNFTNKLIKWHDVMGNPQGSSIINPLYYQDTVHPNDDGFDKMHNEALIVLTQ